MISGQINYKVRVDSELSHSGYSKTTSYVVLDWWYDYREG